MESDNLDPRLRGAGSSGEMPTSIPASIALLAPTLSAPIAAPPMMSADSGRNDEQIPIHTSAPPAPEQPHESAIPSTTVSAVASAPLYSTTTAEATSASSWTRQPPAILSPSTPQITALLPHNSPQTNPEGAPASNDPKRARACEACRGLKVRCEPTDPSNPDANTPCKRCSKAGRQCIVTAPTRKRAKKADSRVAELEKKIDALTASLHANSRPTGSSGSPPDAAMANGVPEPTSTPTPTPAPVPSQVGHIPYPGSGAPLSTQWSTAPVPASQPPISHETPKTTPFNSTFMVAAGAKRKFNEVVSDITDTASSRPSNMSTSAPPPSGPIEHNFSDIVDRGIISMKKAEELWERYVIHMVPHLPAVIFPPGTTAFEVRKHKPALFLSIMTAASSETPQIQKKLVKELMQMFAHKVIIVGEKYLELIQALHVAVIWYYPPDHFEELKFYQLVHIACVMAIDIGLGRKRSTGSKRMGSAPYTWRDHPYRKHPFPDPISIESRRVWLTCYFLASNTSMALHRPNLVRWTPFMAESMEILRTSPEAAKSDTYFCHLVWTHKISEEVGVQFQLDDLANSINIAENRTQHALRGFEYDLEKYSSNIPAELLLPSLKLSFHVLSLYMHEIALHGDKEESIRSYFSRFSETEQQQQQQTPLVTEITSYHISALSACLTAIDGIFETFTSMEIHQIRCLPVFNYVRVAYAVVVLIKLYFAASAPRSELGKIIDKDNMKVDQHLDALLNKFKQTAAEDRSRPAAKFLIVLVMLKTWFQSKGKGNTPGLSCTSSAMKAPCTDGVGGSGPDEVRDLSRLQQRRDFTTVNTPLQLLSEVATNDVNSRVHSSATNNNISPSSGSGWVGSNSSGSGMTVGSSTKANENGPGIHTADNTRSVPLVDYNNSSSGNPATNTSARAAAVNSANSLLDGATSATNGGSVGNQGHDQSSVAGMSIPWLNPAFSRSANFDYNSILGDGFEQAMALAGFNDVAFGGATGVETAWNTVYVGMGMLPMGIGGDIGSGNGDNNEAENSTMNYAGLSLGNLSALGIPDGAAGGFF